VRAVLLREFNVFEKRVRAMSRLDAKAKLLMSTPAVGSNRVANLLLPRSTTRRGSNRRSGRERIRLTPKRCQSGETDYSGRISKIGDASVRERSTRPLTSC